MASVLTWILELLGGTGLLLWGLKKLPGMLAHLDPGPVTTTKLPSSDTAEVMHGGIVGGIIFALFFVAANIYQWPISTSVWFTAFFLLPFLGGMAQHYLWRSRPLVAGHPWRVMVENLAQQAGIWPVEVVLDQSSAPHITAHDNTVVLTTRAIRYFSLEELRFLIALTLWEVRGGEHHSTLADQFALGLTGDLKAAQSALLKLHSQNFGGYLLLEKTERRIERLSSWWQHQQLQTSVGTPVGQIQRLGLP